MNKDTLLQRQNEAQTKFDELTKQVNELQIQIQTILEERFKLQGEYRSLSSLIEQLSESIPETPVDAPIEGEVINE